MKKAIALLLCFMFALSLIACDAKNDRDLIVGYWQGNSEELVDGQPLGSDMVALFNEDGTGVRYTNDEFYGMLDIPFTYTLGGGDIVIYMSTGVNVTLRYQIKDGKLYLTDPQMNTTEEYVKIDELPEEYKENDK